MTARPQYLPPHVSIEPLYNQWYAWSLLLAPATAPLYVTRLHDQLMESFAATPEVHVAALRDPRLAGGPFINHPAERAGEVGALLQRVRRDAAGTYALAEAIRDLDALLQQAPPGMSLEPLYAQIPERLRGYVELTYDLHNHPTPRLVEALLYRSPHHAIGAQSVAIGPVLTDQRMYAFSTPRLGDDAQVHAQIPFRHPAIDALAELRHTPRPAEEISELLGLDREHQRRLAALLTDAAPAPPAPRYRGDGVRVRYFGHACVLVETRDVSIMTDPMLGYAVPGGVARYSYGELPERIDYVLITHGHADHLVLETLLQLRPRIGTILVPQSGGASRADPSLALLLAHAGFPRVRELAELESFEVPGGAITGIPFLGEHGDLPIRAKLAHLVKLAGAALLFAADSNAIEPYLYEHLRDAIGPLDALFLGMESEGAPLSWIYGPLLPAPLSRKMDQSRRLNGCNCERALAMVDRLGPRAVHVYAMGQEPWLGHVMRIDHSAAAPQLREAEALLARCRERGLTATRPFAQAELFVARS